MANIQVTHECSRQETEDWRQQWRLTYAKHGRGAGLHQFLWHVFSHDRYPALSGEQAEAAYAQHEAVEYVVLPNDASLAFVSSTRPARDWYLDVYVFPRNLAWTMAFTHEDGYLGPYFAKHPNYTELQCANNKRLIKQHEIEVAKRHGWAR
jgi:hypothetical protein